MTKKILTVTLNPSIDKIIKINNFLTGGEFRAGHVHITAAGKGINVSRALKNLNLNSIALGFVAGLTGGYIKEELDKEKIDYNFVEVEGKSRVNLTIVDSTKNKTTRILEAGPKVSKDKLNSFIFKYKQLLKQSSYAVLSGRIALGLPNNLYAHLINLAKQKSVKAILDTTDEPFSVGLKAKPFMIKPNLREAEVALKRRLNSLNKLKTAVGYFYNKGIDHVIISLGSKGAVAFDGQKIWYAKPPQIKVKNHVGCGDVLIAGFLYALHQELNFKEALQMAVAAGVANTQTIHPGFIQEQEVCKVFKRIKIKSI